MSLRSDAAALVRGAAPDVDPDTAIDVADAVIALVADHQREWAANLRTCPHGPGDSDARLVSVKTGARMAANLVSRPGRSD